MKCYYFGHICNF